MKKRILFIEDDKFLLEQLEIALEEFEIIPASSVLMGLEMLDKERFDAVLLDIMMPPPEDMDAELVGYGRTTGVEICRRIKYLNPKLPVVVLSVVRDTGILDRIHKAGADEIINKPALPDKISEVLNKILDSEDSSSDME